MPSKSPAQARLMAGIAHGWKPSGMKGPPVSVAKEFNQADKGTGMIKGSKPQDASYAAGGPVLGRTRDFLKEPDRFRGHANPTAVKTDDSFEKKGKGSFGASKSLKPVKPRG